MKKKPITTKLILVSFVSTAVALISINAGGGGLEPDSPPGATMHTLEDIYSAVTSVGTSAPQPTAYDGYLKIDGIDGESLDEKHKDWIDILSYNHGIIQPTSVLPGSSIQPCEHQDFTIAKPLDKSSPLIYLACSNGEHIPSVQMQLCRSGAEAQQYMQYTLTDVIVSAVRPKGGTMAGEDRPIEEVSFNYKKVEWKYTYYSLDGKGNDVLTSWDLAANKSD
ncbi:MAG: type VI secretion system tube protein Hcp [Sedimentisphaerales bacterium]|nr:type VI secretion system tube protein Hcp [Sedimentisphaerales bacterium]